MKDKAWKINARKNKFNFDDSISPTFKEEVLPALKDDALIGSPPNVHPGEESTGFGGSSDKEQFIYACMSAGGSLKRCLETWDLKQTGVGMSPEKVKLMKELAKTKRVDTLEYNDGDLERIKNDFGIDLKAIFERMDGVCSNNAKLIAENKKLKDDFVAIQGVLNAINVNWSKQAENKKVDLKKLLIEKYDVKSDFIEGKELGDLEDYLLLLENAKNKIKNDGEKVFSKEDEWKQDMSDKSDGIELPFGRPISHKEHLEEQTKKLRKTKFGWSDD